MPVLVPTQLAQLTVSSQSNLDSELIDRIFEQLEQEDAFENVDQFLEGLSANETVDHPGTGTGERMTIDRSCVLENIQGFPLDCVANSYLFDIWQVPDFPPVVRDRLMNRTFSVIRRSFPTFTPNLWFLCFRVRLVPLLASFNARMLSNTTSYLNCTNYRVV